jgi:hypothetical protein
VPRLLQATDLTSRGTTFESQLVNWRFTWFCCARCWMIG